MNIGQCIKTRREALGLNKAELSRRAGCSDAAVNMWESGHIKEIGHFKLLGLAKALDCTVSELVGDPQLARREAMTQKEAMQRLKDRYNEHEGRASLFEIIDDELNHWRRQVEG